MSFDEVRYRSQLAFLTGLPEPTPEQKRRVAELYELLGDNETAYVWWGWAAAAGDQDAIDMVELLTEQRNVKEI